MTSEVFLLFCNIDFFKLTNFKFKLIFYFTNLSLFYSYFNQGFTDILLRLWNLLAYKHFLINLNFKFL